MSGTKQQKQGRHDKAASGGAGGSRGLLKWAASHRAISAVAASVVFVGLPLAGLYLSGPAADEPDPVTLSMALAALDRGTLTQAGELATTLRDRGDLATGEEGGPAYVLGVVASLQAEDYFDENRTRLSLLAARHLEDARDLGFPEGRHAQGLLLLGKSLYAAGELDACQESLVAALEANPAQAAQIHLMLADACLNAERPRLDMALAHNQQYLADATLPAEDRHRALLAQAEIRFRQEDLAACRATLAQIPAGAPEHADAALLEGRLLMHEAARLKQAGPADDSQQAEAAAKYKAAIDVITRATASGSAKARLASKASYLIGLCHEEAGDLAAAVDELGSLVAAQEATPESFAAAVRRAQLLNKLNRDAEATAAWRQAIVAFKDPRGYRNPWLPLDELRRGALGLYDYYLAAGQFERVLELVDGFYPLMTRARQTQLSAQAKQAWGKSLAEAAQRSSATEREALVAQAQARFQQAGQDFSRLAELRFSEREYTSDLWNAAECLSEAHDYTRAADVLSAYLRYEPNQRRALALLRLGEALLVQDKLDEAISSFREAIEFDPQSVAIYRCRLLASKAYLEKGEPATAEQLLQDNLQSSLLTPASIEWRESLFALGLLLHLEGRHAESAQRLQEAVSRYPTAPQTLECRYLIADCHRQLAKATQALLESAVVESGRSAQAKELNRLLEEAIEQCDQAVAILQSRQEPGGRTELTAAEKTILRNCHFMKGSALFEMGRYEDSIRAYSTATNRYQQEPQVLDAYVQIADCYRRLNRPLEAKATIEQAKVVLGRMPADVGFADVTNLSRQEWAKHLEWLGSL